VNAGVTTKLAALWAYQDHGIHVSNSRDIERGRPAKELRSTGPPKLSSEEPHLTHLMPRDLAYLGDS